MAEDLPPLVEVAGQRAHLHFWLERPDGLWGGLERQDTWPDDMTGFGSREAFYTCQWYAHESVIRVVPGYEKRRVKTYG
ncbi:hypothetical protein [Acrocarpospora sp. B8E8]|uniref:hypothetical protein n=1 Tax=Acrocarpospora sp. B8E8 TaxID=3153572 RepID=UPI00325E3374